MGQTNYHVNQNKYKVLSVLFFSLLSISTYANIVPKTIVIKNQQTDLFAGKHKLTYWEDTKSLYDFENIRERAEDFELNTFDDIYNSNTNSTYWLYFKISNQSNEHTLRLEFFGFDIQSVTVGKV